MLKDKVELAFDIQVVRLYACYVFLDSGDSSPCPASSFSQFLQLSNLALGFQFSVNQFVTQNSDLCPVVVNDRLARGKGAKRAIGRVKKV